HAEEFVRDLARLLAGMGVAIHGGTGVTGFEVRKGAITRVATTAGEFRPGEVVVAAGAWSARCVDGLGIGLAIKPIKGDSVTVKLPSDAPALPVLLAEVPLAVAPLGDRLRFAGITEPAGFDATVAPQRVETILDTVGAYLPGLERTEIVATWSGLRPSTPDGL